MNLKTKFGWGVIALVAVLVLGTGTMVIYSERRLLISEMDQSQRQLAERLARVCEESLYQSQLVFFNYLQTLPSERGFRAACFVDPQGKIQIHSNAKQIGTFLHSPHETTALTSPEIYEQKYKDESGHEVRDLAVPVILGSSRAGTARIFFDEDILQAFINESCAQLMKRVGIISFVALIFGLAGALWLARTLVTPIQDIVQAMRRVAQGNLDPYPAPKRKDEIGWMAQELNVTIAKLKELDEMKQEFVSSVTHELRSPLTAIDRFVSLLGQGTYGTINAEQKETLVTVQNNTTRLMRFVDDLLTTAKLESKRPDIYLERLDIVSIIRDVHKLYFPLAQERNLKFNLESPNSETLVLADKEKVVQILSNLISNAFKFTKEGQVSIRVEQKPDQMEVSVADTGPGISDEEREKIFDKFYRSRSTATSTKGTGLGLAIVKMLVEAQGGRISVTKNAARGSVFTFFLPRAQ